MHQFMIWTVLCPGFWWPPVPGAPVPCVIMTPGSGLIVASSAIRPNPPGQARGQCQRQTIFIAKQLNKQLYRDPGQGSSTIKLQCDIERRHAGSKRNIHLDKVLLPSFPHLHSFTRCLVSASRISDKISLLSVICGAAPVRPEQLSWCERWKLISDTSQHRQLASQSPPETICGQMFSALNLPENLRLFWEILLIESSILHKGASL